MTARKQEIPSRVTQGDTDVLARLKVLDLLEPHAVLATVGDSGPHTSLVAYALSPDGEGILFATPRGTRKYRNLIKNPAVSMLIDTRSNTDSDYLEAESLSASGRARPMKKSRRREELELVFLGKHPHLEKFLAAPTTVLVLVELTECTHVSQFQKVSIWSAEK